MARYVLTIDDHLAKIDFGKSKDPQKCWLWNAGLNDYGFGVFGFEGKTKYPHRIMWERANNKQIKGFMLKHTCGQNSCCNPDHLIIQEKKK